MNPRAFAALGLFAAGCAGGELRDQPPAPKAADYLAPSGPVLDVRHSLVRFEDWDAFEYEDKYFVSPVHLAAHPFNEVLPSWNLDLRDGQGAVVELRVGDERGWSPWLHVGDWGTEISGTDRRTEFERGRIDVDLFRSEQRFERVQARVALAGLLMGPARHRIALCLSDRTGEARPETDVVGPEPPRELWQRRLPVPFLSQRSVGEEIGGRICSPTSVAMVVDYWTEARPLLEVAECAFDPRHDIYGNWPRNVQTAFSFGLEGWIARFNDWSDVRWEIAAGRPLVCSITVKPGELRGAPYESTAGHLLVLTGFDERGDVLVNDPAAEDAEGGVTTYALDEFEKVWMGKGGTAYVLFRDDAADSK